MKNNKIIQSPDPDIDTLKCPKCGCLWRSKGCYDYDNFGWAYEQAVCPSGCRTWFLQFPLRGKIVSREKEDSQHAYGYNGNDPVK